MSRPKPIATDGTAIGKWNTASVMRRSHIGASREASAAHVPTINANAPAMNAVCKLTIRLAKFSSDSAVEKFLPPRFDGSGPVHDPAKAAATTVAMGATKTTATTRVKNPSTRALELRVHSSTAASHQSVEGESVEAVQAE